MRVWARAACAALLAISAGVPAHEGGGPEPGEQAAALPASVAQARPHRLSNGQLYVSKAMQRTLGLRTEVFAARPHAAEQRVSGEVIADPDAAAALAAAQAGQVEAPPQGWKLPGARVAAGEVLAYLRPMFTQHELAQRRAALAQLDEDLQISEINVERLRLQAQANGTENKGNVYYEQASLEWEGQKEKYRLQSEALTARMPVRAEAGGILTAVRVQPGEAVAEGQSLFEIADERHLRIAVQTFDPALAARVRAAQIPAAEEAYGQALALRGQEPLPGQQGWRLLFDAQGPLRVHPLPGQMVQVVLQVPEADARLALAAACVAEVPGGAAAGASVWVHVAPERFEIRKVPACEFGRAGDAKTVALADGERIVTQGAALLSEYR